MPDFSKEGHFIPTLLPKQGAAETVQAGGATPKLGRRNLVLGGAALGVLGACSSVTVPISDRPVPQSALQGLPYHPLVYHMDLCILSYQLYAQGLVWPFDPYYEKHGGDATRRAFMGRVRAWASTAVPQGIASRPDLGGFRGPGQLAGFAENPRHDPLIFRYDALRPWSPALSSAEATWIEQKSPQRVTDQIAAVEMCVRNSGGAPSDISISSVAQGGPAALPHARDVLIAFEGGTGGRDEPARPPSQSLMGFVLKRHIENSDEYDVHIAFRGSRSGSGARAVWQAFNGDEASGNPDWITGLGTNFGGPNAASEISNVGRVHRGFARSMHSILPKVIGCLSRIRGLSRGRPPRRIFVTGHSLGGALAQHLVSAVLLGSHLGPYGRGPSMPVELRDWPWAQLKLITFGAPFGGDEVWARTLTRDVLQSRFFDRISLGLTRSDPNALAVNQPEIALRLADPDHPAAFRVLNPADPITTLRLGGGKHVGETVYVSDPEPLRLSQLDAHEPADIRNRMLLALADPSLPATQWRYRPLSDLAPGLSDDFDGNPAMFDQLSAAIDQYYLTHSPRVDRVRLRDDFSIFREILVG